MISNFSTLTALALTLATALPAAAYYQHERPDTYKSVVHDVMEKSVAAGSIHNGAALARLGLKADDVISITVFPSSGRIDPPSRGDR
ncbi:hypothetical protein [Paracoccus salsus]|uniref:hypothetical protein n=1 Tax=Paracoccus salsus TaxID=2911061 RepID=UPI001F40D6CA|nr:hypothetical protein [Paracoccus salsus]MCF3972148.1 hypothetical protein [Paracoccus salsus]